MKKYRWIMGVVVIVMLAAAAGVFVMRSARQADEHRHKVGYYCPMHPAYTSDRPGTCPICNMNLVKQKNSNDQAREYSKDDKPKSEAAIEGYARVHLNDGQKQLLGIKTTKVVRKAIMKTITAVGYVAHDIDLYRVQNEYIEAYQQYVNIYRDYRRVRDRRRNWEVHRDLQTKILEAEHKLVLLGLGPAQIEKLRNIKWWQAWDQPELLIFQDNLNYWVFGQIFESDLGFVDVGQPVKIEIPAYHEELQGIVRSVGGVIDPQSRSARVLIEIPQSRSELTANMLAYLTMSVEIDTGLAVPREAVMDLGTRNIVFVQRENGVLEPVEIKVHFKGDREWSVAEGLRLNDLVVVSGNFLLDSESRLKAQMNLAFPDSASEVNHERH